MSVPAYPEYKDSGVAWLGDVPSHWIISKVKHTYNFTTGWTPPSGRDDYYGGNNLWANISDVGQRSLSDTAKRISDLAVRECNMELSPPGSLLFSFKLSIGQMSFTTVPMFTNEALASFQPDPAYSLEFAYYAFPIYIVANATENIYGAKMLNQELIKSAPICLPTVNEQTAIAAFLDRETAKIDALVAEQQRLIALLKEKRQAVISHAVTKGLNPNAPMKDSGIEWLGEIPAHWEVMPLKHTIIRIEQGWSPQCDSGPADSDGQWGVLKVGCVNGDTFNPSENKALPDDLEPIPELSLQRGDVLVSRANTRELVGSAAFVDQDYSHLLLCDKLYRLRLREDRAVPQFMTIFLRSSMARGQIQVAASGASSSMLNIGQSVILEMPMPAPSVAEQAEIAEWVSMTNGRIGDLISQSQSAITLLQERRAALISAAVTGKIDVRGLLDAPAEMEVA